MLSISDSNYCSMLFSVIEEPFVVWGESSICMSIRTRRFVRPASHVVICLSIRMPYRVGLFVGTSSRMPNRVSVFVDIRVGFVCWNCFSITEFEKSAVMNELRKFSD